MIFRTVFTVLLGALLTPLAGYIGALLSPAAVLIWFVVTLFAFASAFKAGLASLAIPAFFGLQYAWPVTCVLLPVLALILRRSSGWTPLIFLAAGGIGGTIRMIEVTMARATPIEVGVPAIPAGALAGTLIGALFGFVLWRFDVSRARKG